MNPQDDLALRLVAAAAANRNGTATEPLRDTVERALMPLLPPERVVLVGRMAWMTAKALNALSPKKREELVELLGGIDHLSQEDRTAAQMLGETFHPSTDLIFHLSTDRGSLS